METLYYDSYTLICDRKNGVSTLNFSKAEKDTLSLQGKYQGHLAYFPCINTEHYGPFIGTIHLPRSWNQRLSEDMDKAITQITTACNNMSIPSECLDPTLIQHSIYLLQSEIASYEYITSISGVKMKPPVCHLTDAVQHTLWHHRTVHPHIDRLMKLQKLSKGIPKLNYPQSIEKCRDCLVAKLRRCARGGPEDISPTVPGQILYIDAGFMFTKSKNTARTKRLTGIHGGSS